MGCRHDLQRAPPQSAGGGTRSAGESGPGAGGDHRDRPRGGRRDADRARVLETIASAPARSSSARAARAAARWRAIGGGGRQPARRGPESIGRHMVGWRPRTPADPRGASRAGPRPSAVEPPPLAARRAHRAVRPAQSAGTLGVLLAIDRHGEGPAFDAEHRRLLVAAPPVPRPPSPPCSRSAEDRLRHSHDDRGARAPPDGPANCTTRRCRGSARGECCWRRC